MRQPIAIIYHADVSLSNIGDTCVMLAHTHRDARMHLRGDGAHRPADLGASRLLTSALGSLGYGACIVTYSTLYIAPIHEDFKVPLLQERIA